ncbi:hypothetical protein AB1L42_16010 [Thalassoglobus sp. JC818]|uniref:hypothetical protein n=1 Tax=Thalassoglobus sp. JC818 TaxID=3232136 RepID=UPI00345A2097
MSLKTRVILTVILVFALPALAFAGLYIMSEGNARTAEKFAQPLGSATAVVLSLILAVIWIPFAFAAGKKTGKSVAKRKKRSAKR